MACVQEDAWYAAASLVGSIASLGEAHIDGMGGMKLVKPLFLVLRRGGNDCKAAALTALQHLTTDRACRAMTARVGAPPVATTLPCLSSSTRDYRLHISLSLGLHVRSAKCCMHSIIYVYTS